jgi:hypothetical protein
VAGFRRGGALTTATTLGFADNADVGPTAGNGFFKRWPDDLAVLQEVGITDVRLTLDWARLQPRPGMIDDDWAERYEQMLAAADAIGVSIWVTLHDGSVPRWFDNDGGFDDDETFQKWWPRWVERAADRFGDHAKGWVPFADIPAGASPQPWRDTWTVLEGPHPVVAALGADADASAYVEHATHVGLVLPACWEPDATIGDRELESASDSWGRIVRDGADAFDGPVVVTGFSPGHDDADAGAQIVEQLVASLDDCCADGVQLEVCFIEPAISPPDTPPGLLDADRNPTPAGRRFLA